MIQPRSGQQRRKAAHLVEFAFVASIALLFVFGIIEYCRFIFMLQVTNNAAREGARYAVVHTGDGTTKDQVIAEVTHYMARREKELEGYAVEVYNVDPNTGLEITGTEWNQSSFGNAVGVRITGVYRPILPDFLMTSAIRNIRITSMMSSEGN